MKYILPLITTTLLTVLSCQATAEIGVISPADAKKLIENPDAKARPLVLDTRGGCKDYFRGHLPTAHHLESDNVRLYEGAWKEYVWLKDESLPAGTTPPKKTL